MRPGMSPAAMLAMVLFAGCACPRGASRGEDGTLPPPARTEPRAQVVRTPADARGAIGQRVLVQGTVHREKLGDTVEVSGLVLTCLDFRFPDDLLGQTATVEGVLDETRDFEAVRGPRGEVSQGTESDAPLLVLRGCEARPGLTR